MSNILEQIDKAIGAHGVWKIKLRQNIDSPLPDSPLPVHRPPFRPLTFGIYIIGVRMGHEKAVGNIFVIVYTLRSHGHEKTIRLISARLANRKEKQRYQEAKD